LNAVFLYKETDMNYEAFVYEWYNLTNGKSYIGYHKGNINDGYISSSHNQDFWNDFNNPKMKWERLKNFSTKYYNQNK
jgi:hypothetical protein